MHVRRSSRPTLWAVTALTATALVGCDVQPQASATTFSAPGLAAAAPEAVGLSSERLERLTGAMQSLVDGGRLAGITTMLARRGQVAHFETFGYRDMAADDPMAEDDIFRIYSMSKPITGVALMMLYEEGKFRLSDPVARYIPEFADLVVWTGEGDAVSTEPAGHLMTIRELMTHTAGLSYGFTRSPIDSLYREMSVLGGNGTLVDMIDKLAEIPLHDQPGSRYRYSVAVDVQGYLVEVLSGQPFDEFLQERVFGPLGMVDTGFHVPPEKAQRFAQVYTYDEGSGDLVPSEDAEASERWLRPQTLFLGGSGLVSTTADYMKFCQMLLNGGELDGVRLLSPTTVDLMSRNHLPANIGEYSPGQGFGLDFSVVLDPVEAETYSKGEYYWGGAAGTWFWIDPAEDLIFVGMIQQFGQGRPDVRSMTRRLVYQAITELED